MRLAGTGEVRTVPSYEFICRECGENFTTIVPYSQKKEVRCPKCGSQDLKEVFGLGFVGGGDGGGAAAPSCSFG
jgi:putative FmdB family regulatory protein